MAPEVDPLFSVDLSQDNVICAYHSVRRELLALIVQEPDSLPASVRQGLAEQYLSALENLGYARARLLLDEGGKG